MRRRVELDSGWAEGNGEFVEIGDRLVDSEIRVQFPGGDGRPKVGVSIVSTSGVPRCARIEVVADDDSGEEVRSKDIRAIEIEAWIEAIVPLFAHEIVDRGEDGEIEGVIRVADSSSDDFRKARAVLRTARRASRRKVTPELLKRVAEVYLANDERPAEAVEVAFNVSPRTAFRYISQARELGLIEARD